MFLEILGFGEFHLQEICKHLLLSDLGSLSRVSQALRKMIYTNDNIWGDQYLREAKKFPLTIQGRPTSWRLIYQMQKRRTSHLLSLTNKLEVTNIFPWDNSLGLPCFVGKKLIGLSNGQVYFIRENKTFELVNLKFLVKQIVELGSWQENVDILCLSSKGNVFRGKITRNRHTQLLTFLAPAGVQIISNVAQIASQPCGIIYRKTNGEIWVSGSCIFGSFGPAYQYSGQPVQLSFPEKIINVSCSLPGAFYFGESGACYFRGTIHRPFFINDNNEAPEELSRKIWEKLPDLPPNQGTIVSATIMTDLIYVSTSQGRMYGIGVDYQFQFSTPYQLFEGWNCVVEIKCYHVDLLIRTLSGRLYFYNRFMPQNSFALPMIGCEQINDFSKLWLTTDYFPLDKESARVIRPLIVHQEPYGDKQIWVDKFGNRYFY